MILYDNIQSSNALKVRILLAELGTDHELRHVPFTRPRPDALLTVNPLGGIPTLVDGAFHLAESNTILRYLARSASRDDLYPADPARSAQVDEFLDRFSITFRPALFRVEALAMGFVPGVGWNAKSIDLEGARVAAEEIAPMMATFEQLVATNGTVLGSYTIADMAAAPALLRTTQTQMDLTAYPNLTALRDTMAARPSVVAARG